MKHFLKLDKDAKIEEIKAAYKKLALTMHPDKSSDSEFEIFAEISKKIF